MFFGLIAIGILTDSVAFAETALSSDNIDTKMLSDIQVVIISVIIVGLGIILHTTLGYGRARKQNESEILKFNLLSDVEKTKTIKPDGASFDLSKLGRSALVGTISGLILVLPQVQKMTENDLIGNLILAL
ncbi:hypothetical protein [Nitrosopumilus sp.]|uniref:hypothetical protein n=1 Tax=Nitrosopumilus sp. TaxID=2024843 RepID=UPI003B59E7C5